MDPVPGIIACAYATLAVWATLQIVPDDLLSGRDRVKWLAVAWVLPFIGALVVVLIRVDSQIPAYEVITTSAHQALGAVLLATTAMLAAWCLRLVPQPEAADALVTPSSRVA